MMRPHLSGTLSAATLATAIFCAGCETTPKADANDGDPAEAAPANPAAVVGDDPRRMEALLARLDALEDDNRNLRHEIGARDRAEVEARRLLQQQRQANGPAATPNRPADIGQPPAVGQAEPQAPAPRGLDSYSRDELLSELSRRVAASGEVPRLRALQSAALSMLTDRHDLDYAVLDTLDPASLEQVVRFHQLMAITFEAIASGEADDFSRRDMLDKVEAVFGDPPLKIEQVALCQRVDGYGIYTPLATHRFVTGRRNALNGGTVHDAVLYLELENFTRELLPDGTYEVEVSWELTLYDSRGDVVLWRQPPTVVTDVSRNERRDFFLAQTIDLPANLRGGGYLLEIRVIDQHSGTRHERTISDIEFVADRALTQQP